jgi:hypothetical protein
MECDSWTGFRKPTENRVKPVHKTGPLEELELDRFSEPVDRFFLSVDRFSRRKWAQ